MTLKNIAAPKRNLPRPDKEQQEQAKARLSDRIFICDKERHCCCFYDDILYIRAEGNYSVIYLKDNRKMMQSYPLASIERQFPSVLFRRVHRSFIVNLNHVEQFIGNTLYIRGVGITISESCREEVFACFRFLRRDWPS